MVSAATVLPDAAKLGAKGVATFRKSNVTSEPVLATLSTVKPEAKFDGSKSDGVRASVPSSSASATAPAGIAWSSASIRPVRRLKPKSSPVPAIAATGAAPWSGAPRSRKAEGESRPSSVSDRLATCRPSSLKRRTVKRDSGASSPRSRRPR